MSKNPKTIYDQCKYHIAIADGLEGIVCGYSKYDYGPLIMAISHSKSRNSGWQVYTKQGICIDEEFRDNEYGYWFITEKDVTSKTIESINRQIQNAAEEFAKNSNAQDEEIKEYIANSFIEGVNWLRNKSVNIL